MKDVLLYLLLLVVTCGCAPRPEPLPTETPNTPPLVRADEMMSEQDFEGAAVAYREILDELESAGANEQQQRSVRDKCATAMVEAGGFTGSQRLWEEMAQDNPESKVEAERMKARAERMMLLQGEELLLQATDDLEQGHRSKARATALACQTLFLQADAAEEQQARLDRLMSRLQQGDAREVEASR